MCFVARWHHQWDQHCGSLWLLDNLIGAGCIVGATVVVISLVVVVLLPTRTLRCWPQEGATRRREGTDCDWGSGIRTWLATARLSDMHWHKLLQLTTPADKRSVGARPAGWILPCPGPCPMITASVSVSVSALAITFLCPGPRLLLWGKINIKMEASPSPNVRRIAMPARTHDWRYTL